MAHAPQGTNPAEKAQKNFFVLLRKFHHAMLVTHGQTGALPHARPMVIAEISEDGSIWFISGADTPKINEIEHDASVLAIMQDERTWLTVTGRAELQRDRHHIHRVWKEQFRTWFSGKDDPNILLIRLKPSEAEYWDDSGLAGLKFALQFAAAYVRGRELRTDDLSTHAKIPL